MNRRSNVDISAYHVVGPENTRGRPVADIVRAVVAAGFTCVQIRSKTASASELITITGEAADVIARAGQTDKVTLLVDDRLDVVLAARKAGIKVDGIHVGQSDIPVPVCREYLGDDAVIGLSAETANLFDYIKTADISNIDYFGAGPLHETATKTDCETGPDGRVITKTFEDFARLATISPLPVVVGGGVKLDDIPPLAATGIGGFFVVSAIAEADDPEAEARKMVKAWQANSPATRSRAR